MHELSADADERAAHDLVAGVEGDAAVLDQIVHQVVDIVGKHPGGAGGQQAGNVLHAHQRDAILLLDASLGRELAVATLIDGDVDDDGALLHALHHLLGDDDGGHLARDECRAEHDVHLLDRSAQGLLLLYEHVGRQAARIAALGDGQMGRHGGVDDLGSERHSILRSHRTDVGSIGDGSQPLGCGEGLQSGYAHSDDHHLSGLDLAYGGEHGRDEGGEHVGGHEDALVAGTGAHRGEGIHVLCA